MSEIRLRQYVVDAFTDPAPFSGNPAAVVTTPNELDAGLMQAIAAQNNLSETAFVVTEPDAEGRFPIRWFTPGQEVDLAGHPTLAASHVMLEHHEPTRGRDAIGWMTREAGPLEARRRDAGLIALDFPARPPEPIEPPPDLAAGLGTDAFVSVHAARDLLVEFADAAAVAALRPDLRRLEGIDALGVIATAVAATSADGDGDAADGPSMEEPDVVSRFFAPRAGVDEDPVTGSAHCTIVPFWCARLGQTDLICRQGSYRRRGTVFGGHARPDASRVTLAGRTRTFLVGDIIVPR